MYLSRLQMIYVHNQKWSCQAVLVQIFRENATASKSVPLQNSTIYLSTFQNLSVKIVNCFCLYLEMYISKLICPNCQGGCNGQLKGTFDLNSSAELNSYSNRRSQKGHRFGLHAEYSIVRWCEFCNAFFKHWENQSCFYQLKSLRERWQECLLG